MRVLVALAVLTLGLAGCAPVEPIPHTDLTGMLLSADEADAAGGWTVTPDDGPLGGSTTDCKGDDYDWPDLEVLAGGSQFLDRKGESVALLVKKVDGDATVDVEAVRGALEPCTPASGVVEHGAMITAVGDDSFAYQAPGDDGVAKYLFYNMVIACGPYHLEALAYDYGGDFDQQQLEDLVAPALERVLDAGDC